MTLRGRGGPCAAVLVVLVVSFFGAALGCELIAAVDRTMIPDGGGGGASSSSGMGGSAPECSGPADCPDTANACMNRTCVAGKCGTEAVAAGTPLLTQVSGDCKAVQCDGAGATATVNDDNDLPNDGMACTDDLCTAGVPSNPDTTAGAPCGMGLVCDGTGQCVGCVAATDCPGMDDDCKARNCDGQGVCGFTYTASGTPTSMQMPGDCKENRCDGAGNVVNANQDADKPVDANECTDDVCMAGVPGHPPTMAGITCNQMGGKVCNGQSACVQCIMASSCPGQDTDCQVRTCTAGACGVSNVAAGTATSTQTPGDCKENQCDGNGMVTIVNKDIDLPNDSNPCTNDLCNAGVPSHTSVMAGTSCGMPLVCDGNGLCVGCLAPSDCPGQDTECQTRTCVANACGFLPTMAGTPVAMQTPGDCTVNQCNGMGAIVQAPNDSDLPVDGNTCTSDVCSGGVPSNPPVVSGTACSQMGGTLCNGAGVCVACLAAADCPGQDTDCQSRTCTMGACGVANAASGTPTSMQTANDCLENQCNGMGAVVSAIKDTDLPVDGNQCTDDVCTAGVPSNPATVAGTACNQMGGAVCSGTSICVECVTGGMCPSGVCTAYICQAPSCSDGVKNGTETDVDCGGGSCPTKCALGKTCLANADCLGDICMAGVCSQINGCDATNTTDLTGGAPVSVAFGMLVYNPKCIRVSVGTNVTFNGNYVNHPLLGGEVVGGVPMPAGSGPFVPVTNTGNTKTFPMTQVGTFPYYCTVHLGLGMFGTVFVVP